MLKHYAPNHEFRINATSKEDDEFFIGFGDVKDADLNLSPNADLCEAASNLFAYMRIADNQDKYTKIAISPIPEHGIGMAINDRIKRASYK
jgi:L-threonylcarbamoyladenylate synthase